MEHTEDYNQPLYAISIAAKILNVSVHTLRMYEKSGLIVPFKKESSHRLYSRSDIDRLKCIRKAINELKIGINGIKMIYSLIPCWKILSCAENERHSCPAYNSHSEPCWTFKHEENMCKDKDCRECPVYQNFTECTSIKEIITSLLEKKNQFEEIIQPV